MSNDVFRVQVILARLCCNPKIQDNKTSRRRPAGEAQPVFQSNFTIRLGLTTSKRLGSGHEHRTRHATTSKVFTIGNTAPPPFSLRTCDNCSLNLGIFQSLGLKAELAVRHDATVALTTTRHSVCSTTIDLGGLRGLRFLQADIQNE